MEMPQQPSKLSNSAKEILFAMPYGKPGMSLQDMIKIMADPVFYNLLPKDATLHNARKAVYNIERYVGECVYVLEPGRWSVNARGKRLAEYLYKKESGEI
jgi:hypothetical protein